MVPGQWTLVCLKPSLVSLCCLRVIAGVTGVPFIARRGAVEPMPVAARTGILLGIIFPTALARLPVFAGLLGIVGARAALLGIAEPLVVVLAFVVLGEDFTLKQSVSARPSVAGVLPICSDTRLQMADEEPWLRALSPKP